MATRELLEAAGVSSEDVGDVVADPLRVTLGNEADACALISATAAGKPARNPATLSGLRASRIVSEQPSGLVSERCREW